MSIALRDLAAAVAGTVVGDPALPLAGAATLETAGSAEIALVDGADKLHLLARSRAGAAIVPRGTGPLDRPTIEVDDVHAAFAATIVRFRPPRSRARCGVSPQAVVDPSARLAADVEVEPLAVIGPDCTIGPGSTIHSGARLAAGCTIGAGSEIFPNAVLYENTRVGARCIVHANAVLGAYGFGYRVADGRYALSAQLGWVELDDDVEVGAGTTIDRGTYGPTRIGAGTKLDNLVMIAHNCRLGRHNMICSQVGVAGSTSTGDWVVMAGQVGVRDHVHIGDRAVLGARSGVSGDIEAGKTVLGEPAIDLRDRKLQLATISKLPEMRKELKQLAARIEGLERAGRADEPPASAEAA
ncbi:UDP-3-O-acylglucosamine N-acyltransferase [Planctomycetia bacterium]|jgi:UDP-3-O-[3-hydroxymyristoyl] glucosamine N-acyltransferase|nr:UDP-3-O-acylglucosamine N-acyltransferase [Planctomycetia bacterium]